MSNPYPRSPEHKAKIAAWGKDRPKSLEHRAKISASRQAAPATPEWHRLRRRYLSRHRAAAKLA